MEVGCIPTYVDELLPFGRDIAVSQDCFKKMRKESRGKFYGFWKSVRSIKSRA